jgi:hypothetical protein
MARLRARVRERAALAAADVAAMYGLYEAYYEATSEELFAHDLAGKTHVIELREDDALRGFSTIELLEMELAGERQRAIFSGDTIIDQAFWGEQALALAFCEFAGGVKAQEVAVPLYWFLISKGYRTYRYLEVFARSYFPHFREATPPREQRLLDALGAHKFAEAYDPASGVIRFPESRGQLRAPWTGVREELRERPEVRFFLDTNPRFDRGEELACLTRLDADNLCAHAKRAFVAGLRGASLAHAA